MNPETLALDAADLSTFGLDEIQAGLEIIRLRPREDGESAYPAIDVMTEAIRGAGRAKRIAQSNAIREQERINDERNRKEHPEDYTTPSGFKEMIAPLVARFGRTGEK